MNPICFKRWCLTMVVGGWLAATHAFGQTVTVQLPTFGVSIDADGALAVKTFADPTGQLTAQRIAAARGRLAGDIANRSELRKVSLAALERTIRDRQAAGKPLDEPLLYLAGLQRVQYVFLDPVTQDVILAGPAEGWFADLSGRVVGVTTRRPVLRLEDWAVALRACWPSRPTLPFLGCTIDPPVDGLLRLREFQKTIPRVISASQRGPVGQHMVQGTREALGMADIRVFGMATSTHFAQVLVEADYRMKCMAIGVEPPPVAIQSYAASLRSPPRNNLQRWWFTPDYQCVRVSDDGLAMELVGQGVQLQTEDRVLGTDAKLTTVPGPAHPAAEAFARKFTEQYPAIAAASPVYAELRNLMDLAIAATWLRRTDAMARAGWRPDLLADENRLATETGATPKKVACVANGVWAGNRLLVPAGGGVSISPDLAFDSENLLPHDPALDQQRQQMLKSRRQESFWWD